MSVTIKEQNDTEHPQKAGDAPKYWHHSRNGGCLSDVRTQKASGAATGQKQYKYLTFHCDWTLHSKLEGPAAQEILSKFDAANPHLKAGVELHELPGDLRSEIDNISQMKYFKKELAEFLQANGFPSINAVRKAWTIFGRCLSVAAGETHSGNYCVSDRGRWR
jgi:hypothetical protein